MAMGWHTRLDREQRREAYRRRRLAARLQKAGAIHLRGEVETLPTWRRRFGAVMALRAGDRPQGPPT